MIREQIKSWQSCCTDTGHAMINSQNPEKLQHIHALVTRPRQQSEALAQEIRNQGGQATIIPMLEIQPLPETQEVRDQILALDQYDRIITISQHAALFGLEQIENYWPQLPLNTRWYAIGQTTQAMLAQFEVEACCPANSLDSEALLALDDFKEVSGEKILLLKGRGGRDLLEQELLRRGATVHTLDLYERQRPEYNDDLNRVIANDGINVILVSSGETLTNLKSYLSAPTCAHCRLIVPSERVSRMAQEMGFKWVYTAAGAGSSAQLAVLSTLNSEGLT